MAVLVFLAFISVAVVLSLRALREDRGEIQEQTELRSLQHAGVGDSSVDSDEKEYFLSRWKARYNSKSGECQVSESKYRQFFTRNKCDYKCGAESHYTAYKEGSTLTFCSHHTRAYQDKLAQSGFVLVPSSASELAA